MPHNLTTPDNLSAKQRRAVAALISTGAVSAAASVAGISRETLHRWLRTPSFTEAIRLAESQALDDLSRTLVALGQTATRTLAEVMDDHDAPWSARVRAADVVLGRLLQLRELATLDARVTELERYSRTEDGRQ